MSELKFTLGVQDFTVNGGRIIRFNPSDQGFIEALYGLVGKLDALQAEGEKKMKTAGENYAKRFDYSRAMDNRMRDAVDSVFGEGFCADVFGAVRLTAAADGLTVIENLILSVLDLTDADIRANMARRSERIAFYTKKYEQARKG